LRVFLVFRSHLQCYGMRKRKSIIIRINFCQFLFFLRIYHLDVRNRISYQNHRTHRIQISTIKHWVSVLYYTCILSSLIRKRCIWIDIKNSISYRRKTIIFGKIETTNNCFIQILLSFSEKFNISFILLFRNLFTLEIPAKKEALQPPSFFNVIKLYCWLVKLILK
jgi:hypothetical protein